MKIKTLAISTHVYHSAPYKAALEQIVDSQRKISKGIGVLNERRKLTNAYEQLEVISIANGDELLMDDNATQLLIDKLAEKGWKNLLFLNPEQVNLVVNAFPENQQIPLIKNRSGIMLVLEEYASGKVIINNNELTNLSDVSPNTQVYNEEEQNNARRNDFNSQLINGLKTGFPVGWINLTSDMDNMRGLLKHEGIISILHKHIYVVVHPEEQYEAEITKLVIDEDVNKVWENSFSYKVISIFQKPQPKMKKVTVLETRTRLVEIQPSMVQFAFSDGSTSAGFPLYALKQVSKSENLPIIRAALIADRHLEMDKFIDICIIRNSELSRRDDLTISGQEALSFEKGLQFFETLVTTQKGAHVELYHTGLEPAVIGVYRAAMAILRDSKYRHKLIVTPMIHRGKGKYDSLESWF